MAIYRVIADLGEVYFSSQESKDGTITHIITCSISDIYPKQKLKKKSLIYLYDETLSLKAKGEVIAVDRKTDQVQIKTTNRELENFSSSDKGQKDSNHEHHSDNNELHLGSGLGILSIILNASFLFLLYANWKIILLVFVMGNSSFSEIVKSLGNSSNTITDGFFAINGILWAFILMPILAAVFTDLHWRSKGDSVSGWISTWLTSISGGIFAWFIAIWVLINDLIPVDKNIASNGTLTGDGLSYMILATIIFIFIVGFLIFMVACLSGKKSKEKIESI